METKPLVHTLSNGLRIVSRYHSGLVSYIGVDINAGSRDESPEREGLAHFVEHTLFKGTDKRRSWQISSRLESIGGELNAFTSKEETMVYTTSPSGYEERALELLADIIKNSRFPYEEISREKDVVIEEINSYLDSPSESVYDEFEELAYAGSSLAHNILGNPQSVKRLEGKDCREFLDKYYVGKNMVVYCCSSLQPEKFFKLAEKYFSDLTLPFEGHNMRTPPPAMHKFDIIRERGSYQANSIIGARICSRTDPRRFNYLLLNNYLGGPGMNSRLNRELREKRGYVYAVDSSVGLMSDCGLIAIYFGCDKKNVGKCRKIIFNEIDRLCQGPMSQTTLEKIKRQYCGQLQVASDHIENRAMAMAKSLMVFGKVNDISDSTRRIMEVSAEGLLEAARTISNENCGILTLA